MVKFRIISTLQEGEDTILASSGKDYRKAKIQPSPAAVRVCFTEKPVYIFFDFTITAQ